MTEEFRVIGPPGCGKTTWLKGQVENAVSKHGRDCVLVASLTKAAAAEVAGRNLPIPKERIGTLHSHAFRAIGNPVVAQSKQMLKLWNKDHPQWSLSDGPDHDDGMDSPGAMGNGDGVMLRYSALRSRMVRDRRLWPYDVRAFAQKWEGFKKETGSIDFTDMIELALENTNHAPGNPAFIFCDEAQDLDRLQLSLVRKWAGEAAKLIIVGDPDQNLYEWRGTDATSFYEGDIPPENRKILSQSYRVPRAVHAVASRLIEHYSAHQAAEYKPRDHDGDVRLIECPQRAPEAILPSLKRYLDEGKSVMILASCSYLLQPVLTVLAAEGIPFHNPYRRKRGDWNPLSHTDRILAYLSTDKELYGENARMWTWAELHKWGSIVRAEGIFTRGAKARIKEMATTKATQGLVIDLEREANLFEEGGAGVEVDSLQWLSSNLLPTAPKNVKYVCKIAKKSGKEVISKTPLVTIGTIHSVKGGEADVVYLFPNLSRQAFEHWSAPGSVGYDAIVRQFYVGVTRARETLVVCNQWDEMAIESGMLT